MMLEALQGYGASVRCAMSATEAIASLPEFSPDLVLSDIAMPGRDGYAVLGEVRAVETLLGRRVPVAAVSAYAHAEDRQRAIAAGFDHYLAKPVDPTALASVVKALAAGASREIPSRAEQIPRSSFPQFSSYRARSMQPGSKRCRTIRLRIMWW